MVGVDGSYTPGDENRETVNASPATIVESFRIVATYLRRAGRSGLARELEAECSLAVGRQAWMENRDRD